MKLFRSSLCSALVLCSFSLFAQQATKRLVVQFGDEVVFKSHFAIEINLYRQFPEFFKAVDKTGLNFQLKPIISEKALNYLREQGEKISGKTEAVDALWHTYKLDIPGVSDQQLDLLADQLKQLPKIKTCYFRSLTMAPLPGDIEPQTDDLTSEQGYMEANPGVNMRYALSKGIRGQGIRVRDVEVGVNTDHEELNEKNVRIADGMTVSDDATPEYTEHGTAVIGVIQSDSGSYGVTGLQHGIDEMVSYSVWTEEKGIDITNGIAEAITNSETGDIIMYELQEVGPTGDYVPIEWNLDVWQLTKAATDAGIVIVAAAGNGSVDLDSEELKEYMDRGNSGAIIIGAGEPDITHARADFSTYGSRVDIQGWGTQVLSPGYGYDYKFGGDFNQQYIYFSGTSSATPVVTSCVIALQCYYHNATGGYLTGKELKKILVETGIPQTMNAQEKIGPLPNMEAALKKLVSETYINESNSKLNFTLYPNPSVGDIVTVTSYSLAAKQELSISNALGEVVYSTIIEDSKEVNLSELKAGVYFVKLTNGKETITKKLIRN